MENNSYGSKHIKEGKIKPTREYKRKAMTARIAKALSSVIFIITMVAIVRTMYERPIRTSNDTVIVESKNFEIGSKVLITKNSKKSIFGVMKNALITQDFLIGKVVAGPYGEIIKGDDNFIYKHGNDTRRSLHIAIDPITHEPLDVPEDGFLNGEYVIELSDVYSSESNYTTVKHIIVPGDNIHGTVHKDLPGATEDISSFYDFMNDISHE